MAYDTYYDDYFGNNNWQPQMDWGQKAPAIELPEPEEVKQPEPIQAPPQAFNATQQVGHNGSTSQGLTREQYRDAWMSSGVNSVQGAKDWLAQHGGTWLSDNGTVRTPFGETLDMLIGARSGSPRAGWGSIDDGGSSGSSSGSSTSRSATVSVPVAPAAPPAYLEPALNKVTTPTVDAARDARKKALLDQLQARMSQDLVVDRNNPVIRSQADAYSANAERARRQYLSNIAERSSPYSTGNMRNEERMTAERLGQNVGGFEAELMGRELAARRQEIQAALDSMGNLLTEAERQQLQRELAAADNALQRYGIENQNSQFYAGLSQSDKHFYDQLAQSGRLADLENDYRNRSLAQSQGQWLDKLGFDTADRQAYWDAVRRGIL